MALAIRESLGRHLDNLNQRTVAHYSTNASSSAIIIRLLLHQASSARIFPSS